LGGLVETVLTLLTHFITLATAQFFWRENLSYPRRARVRAALRAAAERPLRPLVRAARRAEAERSAAVRFRAVERACRDSAFLDAAARPSRFNARSVALERRRDGVRLLR
jgi:hypothetical protein